METAKGNLTTHVEICPVCSKEIWVDKGNWVTLKGVYRHRECYEKIEQPKEPEGLYLQKKEKKKK